MDFKQLFLSFDGRLNRAKFWIGAIILAVINFVISGLGWALGVTQKTTEVLTVEPIAFALFGLAWLVILYPSICLLIKRCHDRNKSGWWLFAMIVPILNIWVFITIYFLRGTSGDNRFGRDPLAA